MTHEEFNEMVEKTALSMIEEGWSVEINRRLPYIAIDAPEGEDGSWFFQGQEADEMLDDIPEWIDFDSHYLLWLSTGW